MERYRTVEILESEIVTKNNLGKITEKLKELIKKHRIRIIIEREENGFYEAKF